MEILEKAESYEEVDGTYKFTHTLIVYRVNSDIYHALSKARYSPTAEIKMEQLTNKTLIPIAAYSPLFLPCLTPASDPLPANSYIKCPRLISYDRHCNSGRPNQIAEQVLREAEICEILKRHSHPNIARYLGCRVVNGRIMGICFANYQDNLMQRVNPSSHMKRTFQYNSQTLKNRDDILDGVERGIKHLHSLRLIHNDINPTNIMFDGDTPIITDFDSCRPAGTSLEMVGRTYEWHDENIQFAVESNDLDALNEIREWLTDKNAKSFKFME